MPQMTPGAARVIDPVLTTVARGYANAAMIGLALFPVVPVTARGGKIVQFGKEAFMQYATARASGAATKRVQIGYSSLSYATEQHALEGLVPVDLDQEARVVPGIDLAAGTVRTVQDILALRLEVAQAALARAAGNYASSNKTALSGTSRWSDLTTGVSDPIADVETGKEAVRAATGQRPNVVAVGAAVFAKLKQHPKVVERIKYTGRDVATPELLAALFGVERVMIGDAVVAADDGTLSDVWGKDVVIAYAAIGSQDMRRPSYGYTYRLSGYPVVEAAYPDRNAKSMVYPVTDEVVPVLAGAEAGYLIADAVS